MKRFLHIFIFISILFLGEAFSQTPKGSVSRSSEEVLIAKAKPENVLYAGDGFNVENVYPNPADDKIYIKYSIPSHITNLRFEIRNILGNVVGTYNLSPGHNEMLIQTINLDP